MKTLLMLSLLWLSGYAPHVQAQTWQLAAGSTLDFRATFEGAAVHGRFKQFSARIRFDLQQPQSCHFDVRIVLSSVYTDNPNGNQTLPGKDFFDVSQHPQSRYIAEHCRITGSGALLIHGNLQLRGVSQSLPITATLRTRDGQTVLEATVVLNRLRFNIGTGQWADTSVIGAKVTVRAHFVLQARAANPSH